MEFRELLKKRRSVRNYTDREVPAETVEEIIRDSTMAPSSGNGQPWRLVVVRDKALIKRISDESKKNLVEALTADPAHPAKKYEAVLKNEGYNVFYNAPCLVIILGPKNHHMTREDCSLFACYFMMAAAERGLGACWVNLGSYIKDPELLETLGISGDLRIVAPIILGYPKSVPEPPPRQAPKIIKSIP